MDPIEPYTLGIDTSLTASGVARLGSRTGAVTRGEDGITKLPLARRVRAVDGLAATLVEAGTHRWPGGPLAPRRASRPPLPALALLEAPDTSGSYGGLVERVYLVVRVTELLDAMGVPVGWVPSPILKGYCIGKGGGKVDGVPAKKAVRSRATELWPENDIKDDNQADATVLAAMALDILGHERRVPDAQALDWLSRPAIEWPPTVTRLS